MRRIICSFSQNTNERTDKSMISTIDNNTEPVFKEDIYLTGITEYGFSWNELVSGQKSPGPEGARFDLAFEGTVDGPGIRGTIKGIDYLEVRSDGKFMLDIQAMIETDDGKRIAVREDGILYPAPDGKANIQLNLQFTTHYTEYRWMNHLQVWALADVDMQRGEVKVNAYKGSFNPVHATV